MKAILLLVGVCCIAVVVLRAQTDSQIKPSKEPVAASAKKPAEPQNVTPHEVEKLLAQNPKPIVLDVRTAEEFAAGHIAGAKNIDAHDPDFAQKIAKLEQTRPVIVHCGAGRRSSQTLPALKQQKFPAIYHMNEGFKAWAAAGKPVEKQ
jgi:phage shock protein E